MKKLECIGFWARAHNDAFKGLGMPFIFFRTVFPCEFDVGGREKGKEEAVIWFGAMEEFMWSSNLVGQVSGGQYIFDLTRAFDCKPPVFRGEEGGPHPVASHGHHC